MTDTHDDDIVEEILTDASFGTQDKVVLSKAVASANQRPETAKPRYGHKGHTKASGSGVFEGLELSDDDVENVDGFQSPDEDIPVYSGPKDTRKDSARSNTSDPEPAKPSSTLDRTSSNVHADRLERVESPSHLPPVASVAPLRGSPMNLDPAFGGHKGLSPIGGSKAGSSRGGALAPIAQTAPLAPLDGSLSASAKPAHRLISHQPGAKSDKPHTASDDDRASDKGSNRSDNSRRSSGSKKGRSGDLSGDEAVSHRDHDGGRPPVAPGHRRTSSSRASSGRGHRRTHSDSAVSESASHRDLSEVHSARGSEVEEVPVVQYAPAEDDPEVTNAIPTAVPANERRGVATGVENVDDPATTSLTDMPPSFRFSTLRMLESQGRFVLSEVLKPSLSSSGLQYDDLMVDAVTSTVKREECPAFSFTWVKATGVPLVPPGINVHSRRARVCLFDGAEFLGNMYGFPAEWNPKKEEQWTFSNKVFENTAFVRTAAEHPKLSLYFELSIVVNKTKGADKENADGEIQRQKQGASNSHVDVFNNDMVELTCGWCLYELPSNLADLEYKSVTLNLMGGTPWAPVHIRDSEISARRSGWRKLTAPKNVVPSITVKFSKLSRSENNMILPLPLTVIGAYSLVEYVTVYREILADVLARPGDSKVTSVYAPALKIFPLILDVPDLFQAFQHLWKTMIEYKKSAKVNLEERKTLFVGAVMHVWSLLYSNLPVGSTKEEHVSRSSYISQLIVDGPRAVLLRNQPPFLHKPFHSREVSYDYLAA